MLKKLKVIVFLVLIAFSTISSAATWSGWTNVTEIYPAGIGLIYVKFEEMINEGCSSTTWMLIPSTTTAINRLYSSLLVAKASNLQIRYQVDGCNVYPVIVNTWIK